MKIKKIGARKIFDSRKEKTIQVIVKTSKGNFFTSAPSGKSKGSYEIESYKKSLEEDIRFINYLDIEKINKIINGYENSEKPINLSKAFFKIKDIERFIKNKIGGNSLFALEASLLKAFAKENEKELWEFLLGNFAKRKIKFPIPVGNAIGGGLHSFGRNGKKPDFQEFLFIPKGRNFRENFRLNEIAYYLTWKNLGYWIKKRNDEGAWESGLSNEKVFKILKEVQRTIRKDFRREIDIGVDCAASSFYKNGFYYYKNPLRKLDKEGQKNYMDYLIRGYNLFYIEDLFEENDFDSFSKLREKIKKEKCLIIGDDLTATNPERLKKAIQINSISGIIVKPNQIGSLLKLKEVIEIAKKSGIKTIISHRSGETLDDTIADLAVGFQCDFIKTGIFGKVREMKLKRLLEIERNLRG